MSKKKIAAFAVAGLTAAAFLAHTALAQTPSAAITAAVADPGRPEADSKRDANRHPAELLAFAGVKPGQQVAEFSPAGGYFTRLLATTVGAKGHVYGVYNAGGEKFQKGAMDLAAANPVVTTVPATGGAFTLPAKVDVEWMTDNYHDYFNATGVDMAAFDKAAFDALKPGGVFLIVDYNTVPGAGQSQTSTLHRIDPALVKSRMETAGFKLAAESKVLANPKDDHTLKIFDPTIRGQADQFVLLFRKPK